MGTNDLGTDAIVPREDTVILPSQRCHRRSFLAGGLLRTPLWQAAGSAATPNATQSNLDFASVLEAARAIRRGEVSSVELTTRLLERIERFNPQLNAIVTLTPDEALARGEWWGPLHDQGHLRDGWGADDRRSSLQACRSASRSWFLISKTRHRLTWPASWRRCSEGLDHRRGIEDHHNRGSR